MHCSVRGHAVLSGSAASVPRWPCRSRAVWTPPVVPCGVPGGRLGQMRAGLEAPADGGVRARDSGEPPGFRPGGSRVFSRRWGQDVMSFVRKRRHASRPKNAPYATAEKAPAAMFDQSMSLAIRSDQANA